MAPQSSILATIIALLAAAPLHATPARAAEPLRTPACPALAEFLAATPIAERTPLNQANRLGFATALETPEFATLYGRPASSFTADQATAAEQHAAACAAEAKKARDRPGATAFTGLANEYKRHLAPLLAAIAKAQSNLDAALATLAALPDPVARLRALAALEITATGGDARQANRLAGPLDRDAAATLRTAQAALRDLPASDAEARLRPVLARTLPDTRTQAAEAAARPFADLPATPQSLRSLERDAAQTRELLGPALGETALAAYDQAVAARAAAIADTLLAEAKARLDAMPASPLTLAMLARSGAQPYAAGLDPTRRAALDRHAAARRQAVATEIANQAIAEIQALPATAQGLDSLLQASATIQANLVPLLSPADANRFNLAALARGRTIAPSLLPAFQAELAATPATPDGLAALDRAAKAMAARLAPLGPEATAPFAQAATARRATLAAAVAREEARLAALPLRGHTFAAANGTMKVLFRTRTAADVTLPDGTTIEVPWEQEAARVVLRLPTGALVLTRDGGTLAGGPVALRMLPPG
jgi:hypothetical protein